jgi:hypothetical protein
MEIFRTKHEPTAHWSVDFVEHLRTVHFALMTLAAALLVLASSSRDTKIERALTQITEICDLQKRWSEAQIESVRATAKALKMPEEAEFRLTIGPEVKASRNAKGIAITIDELQEEFERLHRWSFPDRAMWASPVNLSQFKAWWNRLQDSKLKIALPDLLQTNQQLCDASTAPISYARSANPRLSCHESSAHESVDYVGPPMSSKLVDKFGDEVVTLEAQFTIQKEMNSFGDLSGREVTIRLPVPLSENAIPPQALAGMFADWHTRLHFTSSMRCRLPYSASHSRVCESALPISPRRAISRWRRSG